jgi:hypothetical protein
MTSMVAVSVRKGLVFKCFLTLGRRKKRRDTLATRIGRAQMTGFLHIAALLVAAQPPAATPNWSFDEITLTNGAKFQGLLLDDGPRDVRFQTVKRRPGQPTFTLTWSVPRGEVALLKKLTEAERAQLKERISELDQDGSGERKRIQSLDLAPAMWLGEPDKGKVYRSEYFTLVSDASEEVIRRAAVRLEQIYAAYARFLPPTVADGRPTTIQLAPDRESYKLLLAPLGHTDLINPAAYDPRANLIVCGSDLRRLGKGLEDAKFHHAQQIADLDRYEASLRKLYKDQELKRYLDPVKHDRGLVYATDRKNGEKFDLAASRLFAVLYHEAFHAYAATFVYPPLKPEQIKEGKGTGELPRWLNEGMAQLFETAVVEAGELRADYPDPVRLEKVKDAIRGKGDLRLVPLGDLLVAGKDAFLSKHAEESAAASRAYLTGWAAAYYLTFERRLVGTAKFRQYLIAINTGTDPRAAFETLVGQPLTVFERQWQDYLLKLTTNSK